MLKSARLVSIVFAMLVLVAPSARAAESEVRQIRGNIAEASFGSAYDCGYRTFDVAVMEQAVKSGAGGPVSEEVVIVHIQEYDYCLEASKEYSGYAPLLRGEFSQTSLNAASLTKTVTVCDNEGACRDFAIDLDWTGYGETTVARYVSRQDNGESKFMDRWSGNKRLATVTGTASDGAFDYATGDANASLSRVTSGQIVIASGIVLLASPVTLASQAYTLQTRGDLGEAVLYVESACGYRQLNVSVADLATKYGSGAPEPEKMVSIYGSDYDSCEGDARTYQGTAILAPGDYTQTGVDAAALTTTVQVCGPNDCWDIALDLTWTGEGETATSSYVSKQVIDGTRYNSRSSSSYRNATLTGTVLDGAFDFMAGEAWGTLHTIKSGSTTITK